MKSNYDSYGVSTDIQEINISVGSIVEYTTRVSSGHKSKKVKLIGVWNGFYVAFNDKEKTIVRTTRWLTLVEPISKKIKF